MKLNNINDLNFYHAIRGHLATLALCRHQTYDGAWFWEGREQASRRTRRETSQMPRP
jgi:hypothetical protein